ncbi:transposase [Halorubrum amylolyticum]|uniref:transposase n=1 Tax=Halorubrum amylolyticum TaxID=2508724 RepID=UPI0013E8BD1B
MEPRRRQGLRRHELPRGTPRLRCPTADQAPRLRTITRTTPKIDDELYNQRSVCETVNSVIKRSNGSAVRARAWYRQFREIVLAATVYNVEQGR